ncbi:carbohydrate esterase family 4 protein [Coprinellus micaceus]|uniref:Carbohydrate esterase family 4 protein n=1 Tax=Coprinellus micaceus TaxID=71717 RepID=A0A4Y7THI0_COPMI|nr:carbohydrate esterase family 4 protein [Coprinellus micaceus]
MARFSQILSFLILSAVTSTYATPTPEAEPAEAAAEYVELAARAPAQVITKCTVANTVALTFDDGPYQYMREVVRQIEAAGGKTTFFVNGKNWGCIYDNDNASALKYAYDRGHQIASHTWSHKDLTTLTWDQIHHEMWLTEQAITRITGGVPAWMRPPYGNHNSLVREASGVRNQTIALWDFDSGDSTGSSVSAQKTKYTNIANSRPSTILSLQHEVHRSSVYEVLPHAISVLRAKGYRFVTLADCLGRNKYQRTGAPEARNANWKC